MTNTCFRTSGVFGSIFGFFSMLTWHVLQVALLSQTGRVMLRVIKYFAKSLKITQGHSK